MLDIILMYVNILLETKKELIKLTEKLWIDFDNKGE